MSNFFQGRAITKDCQDYITESVERKKGQHIQREERGAPPAPVATAAKAQGIIIYCIGLIGSDGLDISALNDWATDPDASHVAVTPDTADLEALFAQLGSSGAKVRVQLRFVER